MNYEGPFFGKIILILQNKKIGKREKSFPDFPRHRLQLDTGTRRTVVSAALACEERVRGSFDPGSEDRGSGTAGSRGIACVSYEVYGFGSSVH